MLIFREISEFKGFRAKLSIITVSRQYKNCGFQFFVSFELTNAAKPLFLQFIPLAVHTVTWHIYSAIFTVYPIFSYFKK